MHHAGVHVLGEEAAGKDVQRSLHYFAYFSAKTLCKLRMDLRLLHSRPADPVVLCRFAERLETLAVNAATWGFQDINSLAQALMKVLFDLRSGTQSWDRCVAEALGEGLDVLATLVSDCEGDFQRRNSVVRLLNSLVQPHRTL